MRYKIKKEIIINNFKNLEQFLKLSVYSTTKLKYLNLEENIHIPGIDVLLEIMPDEYNPQTLYNFYKITGLKLQVEIYKDSYLLIIDRLLKYPIEELSFFEHVDAYERIFYHDCFKPLDDADIIIRIIREI